MIDNTEITIRREVFLNLCAAASSAREWMAVNAPATEWANRVRQDLNNAHAAGVNERSTKVVNEN